MHKDLPYLWVFQEHLGEILSQSAETCQRISNNDQLVIL